ncbi:MAG TPA: c-type cytochrome domain-containing protein, partial [Verrucomicrobiaceae bacterium]
MRFPRNRFSLALAGAAALAGTLRAEEKISFNFQIKPLLAEHCFKCHGQDEKQRKAKLRLDVRDWAIEKKAIIPGNSAESEVIKRLLTHEEDDMMPPPKERKPVSEAAVALIRRWIDEGAEYQRHWSFIAPEKPATPDLSNFKSHISNPIDAFVLSRLEKENLAPAAPADPETWLRRVTLDLTGLPPTVAEQ